MEMIEVLYRIEKVMGAILLGIATASLVLAGWGLLTS